MTELVKTFLEDRQRYDEEAVLREKALAEERATVMQKPDTEKRCYGGEGLL